FDASLTAIFMPLLFGKSIIIGSKQSVDIFEDNNLLKYAPYDFIKITPSHLELLQPKFKAFNPGILTEKLVIGGEALHPAQFDLYIEEGIDVEVINEYGPTEATVGCTTYSFHTIAEKDKISNGVSIGKPVNNVVIYILDDSNHLVPVGVKGEICIGGSGLARGYLNRSALTAEKFIIDPFSDKTSDRLYRTGDIGRWLPDGNIEYLGRIDDQVKIRGYRVELGEVEHVLQQFECVSQGVVLGKEDKQGGKRLVSYYVPDFAAVKSKERELDYQRVANWKELYETEYGQTEGDDNIDTEFNIIGWNDSFTGEAIPAEQMKEWLDDIVKVVLLQNPGSLLEIGCGTGLIYYQLAGKVKKYIGSDLSASSINQITQQISKGLRDYGDTELFTAPAHEVMLPEGEQVDTILLNSMVQYFPGEDYMNAVIEKSMSQLKDKGRIIIGDVRDNRLLELFKGRLRIQKLQDSVTIKEFKWGMEQDLIKEEELCFSPSYFYSLKDIYPRITHVEIQWKQGSFINELTLYRYTVVIYVGIEKEQVVPQWQNWNEFADRKSNFSGHSGDQRHTNLSFLGEEGLPSMVAIKDVPNPRLWRERLLNQALQNRSLRTVGDIMHALEREDQDTIKINQLLNSAESEGYSHKFLVHADPLRINLLFEINPLDGFIRQPPSDKIQLSYGLKTNIPLFSDISYLLQKDIRDLLNISLPDYMVPSEFTALRQLPLTINGKVDRLFLSQREDRVFVNTLNYLPPVTDLEKGIAEIWKDLLHLERVGIEDDFFDLGGHSLLAMRVISAIRKTLQVELNIKALFVHPTIGLLARHIQKLSKGLLLPPIEIADPRPGHIPLSFSQERLWFIDQLDGSLQYHIPAVLRLKGSLDIAALEGA
ncbi:MAG: AMP-binding protein, partial [Ferruginibacter sp.]|nr:AMP-binding protein [Chitinophagaceae bacterium]